MAEVVLAGGLFVGAIWGWIDLARRILRRIRGEEPERSKMNDNRASIVEKKRGQAIDRLTFSEDEIATIMIPRAENGDQVAVDWLIKHNYQQVAKQ